MKILDELSSMIAVGTTVLLVLFIVFFVGMLLYRRKRKISGIQEMETDYSMLNRQDSEDYLKFDDIKDGMIICDGGYRFVAAVRAYGFDFYHTSAEVQAAVQQNFVGFINTITSQTTYRQHSKAIDMEHTMDLYEKAYQKVELELFDVAEDLRNIELSQMEQVYNDEEKRIFESKSEELLRKKKALEWRKQHLRDEMAYVNRSSGGNVAPERVQCWIFDWSYNSIEFSMELTKEQIYEKAIRELNGMANAKIHALQNCKVRAVRCTTEDLIEMTRRYSAPLSANRFRMRDVLKTSFFDDFNYETNHDEMMDRARESIARSSTFEAMEEVTDRKEANQKTLMPTGNLNNIGSNKRSVLESNEKISYDIYGKDVIKSGRSKEGMVAEKQDNPIENNEEVNDTVKKEVPDQEEHLKDVFDGGLFPETEESISVASEDATREKQRSAKHKEIQSEKETKKGLNRDSEKNVSNEKHGSMQRERRHTEKPQRIGKETDGKRALMEKWLQENSIEDSLNRKEEDL